MLLRHGASLEVGDNTGCTPLHCAALAGNCGIARHPLTHGSRRVRAGQGSRSGAMPLHFATGKGDDGIVQVMLQNGAKAMAIDQYCSVG